MPRDDGTTKTDPNKSGAATKTDDTAAETSTRKDFFRDLKKAAKKQDRPSQSDR
ncbi:hypothetical protein BH24ACT21_BH24ACT21_03210 [soil metagenome]